MGLNLLEIPKAYSRLQNAVGEARTCMSLNTHAMQRWPCEECQRAIVEALDNITELQRQYAADEAYRNEVLGRN
jgi:hypothetical protein